MPLPEILMPAALPPWLAAGHERQEAPLYAHAPMSTGHSRTRRVFTAAERFQAASMELTQAQLTAFHEWFENTLQAGLLRFAAQFQDLGPALVWFDAQLLGYVSRRLPQGGRSVLECQLVLRGAPSLTGPDLTTATDVTVVRLIGRARLEIEATAEDLTEVELTGGVGGTAADLSVIELDGFVGDPFPIDAILLEDGDALLTETGDFLLIESGTSTDTLFTEDGEALETEDGAALSVE